MQLISMHDYGPVELSDSLVHPNDLIVTDQERDVLELVARGDTNAQIGEHLFISEATVKSHVSRIMTKLNLPRRAHAAILAYETGLVVPRGG